jgi:hypothetical protein
MCSSLGRDIQAQFGFMNALEQLKRMAEVRELPSSRELRADVA